MRKTLCLLLVPLLLFAFCASAPAENDGIPFRAMPGYTCFPLFADGGRFLMDCPMSWFAMDNSPALRVPAVSAFGQMQPVMHMMMIAQMDAFDQAAILADEAHPLNGFLHDGLSVLDGKSTEHSRILETFDLHGLKAVRVDMVGQDFEMIWVRDPMPGAENQNTCWFIMIAKDPDDAEYTDTIAEMVDSFTVFLPDSAPVAPESDFAYTSEDGGVCLTRYEGEDAYVRVPDTIGGLPVTALADRVFYETDVRGIELPDSVRAMGANTFGGCTQLAAVRLPASLTVLPAGTYESCFRLFEAGLNEGLERIESTAFWGNQYMVWLLLPETLREMEDGALQMCDRLAYIVVPGGNTSFKESDDGLALFTADGERMIFYSYLNEAETYTVPDGVRHIDSNCFRGTPLKQIVLPEGLESIGFGAFDSTGITELHIPASVTEIGFQRNVYIGDAAEPSTAEYLSVGGSIQTVYGAPGSAAEKYAAAQKLTFVPEE